MRAVAQRAAISCFVLTFGAVAPLMAQACLGYPTERGQLALNPGITFGDGFTSFGATMNANLADPLALEAGFGIASVDDVDSNGVEFSGRGAFELDVPDMSVCPLAGLSYSRLGDVETVAGPVTSSALAVPIGVGVGKTFPASDEYIFSLSGAPHVLWIRDSVTGDNIEDRSDSNLEFGLNLTATLGTDRFYGGFSLGITTVEDSGTSFRIGAGIPFDM